MLAVNLHAPFPLAQCTRFHAGTEAGRILLISRAAAFTGGIIGPHHAASKAGQHALTHFPASRPAATGATVNALAPAPVTETRMLPGDPAQLRGRCPPAGPASHPRPPTSPRPSPPRPTPTNQVISLDGGIDPRQAPDGIHHGARTSRPGTR